MSARTEYIEQENLLMEVESPGTDALDEPDTDVLVLTGENFALRIEGDLDAFAQRVNDAVKAQGWDGAR